jgi:predicted TIM-barrel fold metal-dependent hydrolase
MAEHGKMDIEPVKLVEMHSHIENEDGVSLMRRERLSYALVMVHKPADPKTYELARANKDLIGVCPWLDPTQEGWLAPARWAVANYPDVVKGLKIHPAGKYQVTYDLLAPLFEFANEHDLMVQSHTMAAGDGNDWCSCHLFRPLMNKFPKTRLLLVHGAPPEEAFEMVHAFDHIYIDTSYTAWGAEYAKLVQKSCRPDRVVFGIDSPVAFPKDAAGHLQPHFRQAASEVAAFYDNDPKWAAGIFWRNAESLLGFEVPERKMETGV